MGQTKCHHFRIVLGCFFFLAKSQDIKNHVVERSRTPIDNNWFSSLLLEASVVYFDATPPNFNMTHLKNGSLKTILPFGFQPGQAVNFPGY